MANTSTNDILKTLKVSFEQSNYKNGITHLLEKKSELPQDVFHFYLGNFYLKQGELGAGRYNLEKAKSLGYRHSILENNIKFVEGRVAEKGVGFTQDTYSKAVSTASNLSFEYFVLASLILFSFILFLRKIKTIKNNVITIVFLVFAFLPIGIKSYLLHGVNVGIVLKEIKLYDGPSKIFSDIRDLPAGTKLILGQNSEGWLYVQYPVELSGWVEAKDLGLIK